MFPFFQILKRTVALGVSLLKRWEILQWPITDYQHLFFKDNLALYFDWLTGFSGANWWTVHHLNKVEIRHSAGEIEKDCFEVKSSRLYCITARRHDFNRLL